MKFRGKMIDITCIKQFSHLVHVIARMAKFCIIRITQSHVYFVVNEVGGINGGCNPGLWAEMEQGHFFNEFDMEGVSADNNEIFFEFVPDKLAKTINSLKSSQSTRSLKMKLTKKLSPCITFEVELPSLSAKSRIVVHDVPVTLIPRRLWHIYQEPQMPSFQASIYLPPLRQLRHLLDRMKALSSNVTLSANRRGTFIISIATDTVDVSTYFKNLAMPKFEGEPNEENFDEFHSATVSIKKLSHFLQGEQISPKFVICNIVAGKVVHLFLLHDDITLQYFLPLVSS